MGVDGIPVRIALQRSLSRTPLDEEMEAACDYTTLQPWPVKAKGRRCERGKPKMESFGIGKTRENMQPQG